MDGPAPTGIAWERRQGRPSGPSIGGVHPVDALRLLGGSARTSDLLHRCSRRALQDALATGAVVRVARGRYSLPDASDAAVAVAAAPGVLAGAPAARSYGWDTLHPQERVVVAVLPGQRLQPRPGVTYRRRRLDPEERRQGRTGPVATVVECAASLQVRGRSGRGGRGAAQRPGAARGAAGGR